MRKTNFLKLIGSVLVALMLMVIGVACENEVKQNAIIVEYNSLNGTEIVEISDIEEGSLLQRPEDPVKDGFVFVGWYNRNGEESGEWGDLWIFEEYPVWESMTLFAKWEKKAETYTVTFFNHGKEYSRYEDLEMNSVIEEPELPKETGDEIFSGWYTSDDNGQTYLEKYDFTNPIKSDLELYAKWEAGYPINFDYQGATQNYETENILCFEGQEFNLPVPLKSEAVFDGWYTQEGEKYPQSGIFSGSKALNLTARWTEGTEGLEYKITGEYAVVSKGTVDFSVTDRIIIGQSFEGKIVKEISMGGFAGAVELKEIILPEGLELISQNAFYQAGAPCSNLSKVVFPSTLRIIGADAFNGCSALKSIELNEGLEILELRAFSNSGLEEITIPSTVTDLKGGVFNNCAELKIVTFLREATAEGGVTKPLTGNNAEFRHNHPGLVILVPENSVEEYKASWSDQLMWGSVGEVVIFSADSVIDGFLVSEDTLYLYCGKEEIVRVNESIEKIHAGAFAKNNFVKKIYLHEGITEIGAKAFDGCQNLEILYLDAVEVPSIKSVNINSQKVTSIFNNLDETFELYVPYESYKDYTSDKEYNYVKIDFEGYYITYKCDNIIYYEEKIPVDGFANNIPLNLQDKKLIGWYTSENNGETLSETAFDFSQSIHADLILYAKYEIADFGDMIILDYQGATHNNETESVLVSAGNEYELPRPYKNDATFEGWYDSKGTRYDLSGVWGNAEIDQLTARWTEASIGLSYVTVEGGFKVAQGSFSAAELVIPEWHNGQPVIRIGGDADKKGAFESTEIQTVVVPEGIKYIGARAFFGVIGLTEITIPESVETIGNGAFNRCENLKSVTILRSVVKNGSITKLMNNAVFRLVHCGIIVMVPDDSYEAYTAEQIDGAVNHWGSQQNRWGTGATWSFPSFERLFSTRHIDENGFIVKDGTLYGYLGEETAVSIPSNITKVASGAFAACDKITQITIHDGVTEIGAYAFANTSITEIRLPGSITKLGARAFDDCKNLTSVTIEATTVPEITSVQLWAGVNDNVLNAKDIFSQPAEGFCLFVPGTAVEQYEVNFPNITILAIE